MWGVHERTIWTAWPLISTFCNALLRTGARKTIERYYRALSIENPQCLEAAHCSHRQHIQVRGLLLAVPLKPLRGGWSEASTLHFVAAAFVPELMFVSPCTRSTIYLCYTVNHQDIFNALVPAVQILLVYSPLYLQYTNLSEAIPRGYWVCTRCTTSGSYYQRLGPSDLFCTRGTLIAFWCL